MRQQTDRSLYRGEFLEFFRTIGGWEYVGHADLSNGVSIVAVTAESRLLLVEQERPPQNASVIELPAGLVTPYETEVAAVTRELVEETGYRCSDVAFLCSGTSSPGLTDERTSLYLATGLKFVDVIHDGLLSDDGTIHHRRFWGLPEEGERIVLYEVPLNRVVAWLGERQKAGVIVDLKVYAGLFFVIGFKNFPE